MKKSWLRNQLTKAKQAAPMWADFIDAVQEIIERHAEQYLDRAKRRVSLFDADKQDLEVMLRELGDFFALGDVSDENLPLVIMQRQDQIHSKKTIYPLVNTLIREFRGVSVTWEPLFAPVDQETWPYGTKLLIERELADTEIPVNDWFMTSRGVIRVPLNQVRRSYGGGSDSQAAIDEFESIIKRVIYPLVPLRIVCDGQQYFLSFDLVEFMEYATQSSMVETQLDTSETSDISNLKGSTVLTQEEIPVSLRDDLPPLPRYRVDGLPCDALTIDRLYT